MKHTSKIMIIKGRKLELELHNTEVMYKIKNIQRLRTDIPQRKNH